MATPIAAFAAGLPAVCLPVGRDQHFKATRTRAGNGNRAVPRLTPIRVGARDPRWARLRRIPSRHPGNASRIQPPAHRIRWPAWSVPSVDSPAARDCNRACHTYSVRHEGPGHLHRGPLTCPPDRNPDMTSFVRRQEARTWRAVPSYKRGMTDCPCGSEAVSQPTSTLPSHATAAEPSPSASPPPCQALHKRSAADISLLERRHDVTRVACCLHLCRARCPAYGAAFPVSPTEQPVPAVPFWGCGTRPPPDPGVLIET
jgi:hypothetical protein